MGVELGRISGPLLSANLLRAGVDLAFETDLLYLDVTNQRVGINTASPVYDLDSPTSIRTNISSVTTQANLDNLTVNASGTIGSLTGPILIQTSTNSSETFFDQLLSDYLVFNDNNISSISNRNIRFDPNGTGRVVFNSNAKTTGDVSVTGNITTAGNLRSDGTIYVGDTPLDTVTIVPDFTQSIIPGDNDTWSLGEDTGDSSPRRWSELRVSDLTQATVLPDTIKVSDQLYINGLTNQIFALQSNDDVFLNPDTGITYIEQTKWQNNDITNLINTPITFASTGIGYLRFIGDSAMVIPYGGDATRPTSPEVGQTRWNTDQNFLECWDGTVWSAAIGAGGDVTYADMEELVNIYTLALA